MRAHGLLACALALLSPLSPGSAAELQPVSIAQQKGFWQADHGYAVDLPPGFVRSEPGAADHGVYGTIGLVDLWVWSSYDFDDDQPLAPLPRVCRASCDGTPSRVHSVELGGAQAARADCAEKLRRCRVIVTRASPPEQSPVLVTVKACAPLSAWPAAIAALEYVRTSFVFTVVPQPGSADDVDRRPPPETPRTRPCHEHPAVRPPCFPVHGRLRLYASGPPVAKIWISGTHRLLGISDARALPGFEKMPAIVWSQLDERTDLFGDFEFCPFTPEKAGVMRLGCVQAGRHLRAVRR